MPFLDQDKDKEDAQPLVTRKRRRAITDTERKALRDYYFDQANGKPAQKVIRTWFLKLQLRTAGSSHAFEVLNTDFEIEMSPLIWDGKIWFCKTKLSNAE